jgi:hypothetical protein
MATLNLQRVALQIGTSSHFDVVERLDSVNYRLSLYTVVLAPGYGTNPTARTGWWCWDLRDSIGNAIVLGAGLGSGVDLLFPFRGYSSCPPGKLFVWTNDGLDPDLAAFSDQRAVLYYQPIADVVASGGET